MPILSHEAWISDLVNRSGPAALQRMRSEISRSITSTPVVYVHPFQAFDFPIAITSKTWMNWSEAAVRLLDLIYRFVNLRMAHDRTTFLRSIGLSASQIARLDRLPYPASANELMARPDFFLGSDGPLFLESNVDSSLGGLGTADALADIYKRAIQRHMKGVFNLAALPVVPALARQMRALSEPSVRKLRVAIVDWEDEIEEVPWPYDRLVDALAIEGILARTVPPSALSYIDARLEIVGEQFDMVYRGLTPTDRLWSNWDSCSTLWSAICGKLPSLSSPWSVVFSSKAIFGALWEASITNEIGRDDAEFVRRHIPWTWQLDRGGCCPSNSSEFVDTYDYVIANAQDLVLKSPSDGSCKNVTVGRFVDPSVWKNAVEAARMERGFVVQRYVEPTQVTNSRGGDKAGLIPFFCNFAVFVLGTCVAGTCIRGTPNVGPYISCMYGASEGIAMNLDVA